MKAVIYARVSTDEQTTDNQIPVLQKMAAEREWEIVNIYSEEASAWKAGHQRELARLMYSARRGKFDILLVWALDRLSRQGALAILELVNRLSIYGVKVVSYQEAWTEAPGELGELLYALTGWVASYESKRRSERTLEGLARAKRNGKRLGRPPGAKDKKKRQKRGAMIYA